MKKQTDKILFKISNLPEKEEVDWIAVERAVQKLPDINEYDEYGTTLSESIKNCGYNQGYNLEELIRLFVSNGYDFSANDGNNGTEALCGLCWSSYDKYVIDAAKLLLQFGADPKITYDEAREIDYDSGAYGSVDWRLSGDWFEGNYESANIFTAYWQILDAYKDGKDYQRIKCFSDCCGRQLRKVEFLPDPETGNSPKCDQLGCDGSLVFWFDDLPLIASKWVDFEINPFPVEESAKPLIDISSHFSEVIGATLEKFVFIDSKTAKMCFNNEIFILMTGEYIDQRSLSFFEIRNEQPLPNLVGTDVDKIVFLCGKEYSSSCTKYAENSVGLICGDRAFLLYPDADMTGRQHDGRWVGCIECSPEILSMRQRYLCLPKMKVERQFHHNHRMVGMRLSCNKKYFYLATDHFDEVSIAIKDEKINSYKALLSNMDSEHLIFMENGKEAVVIN